MNNKMKKKLRKVVKKTEARKERSVSKLDRLLMWLGKKGQELTEIAKAKRIEKLKLKTYVLFLQAYECDFTSIKRVFMAEHDCERVIKSMNRDGIKSMMGTVNGWSFDDKIYYVNFPVPGKQYEVLKRLIEEN